MPKHGRSRKKSRTHNVLPNGIDDGRTATTAAAVPKSLIVRRGKTCHEMKELVTDLRRMMLPYTAMNYQGDSNSTNNSKKISLYQYSTSIALPMGITHILQLSQSSSKSNNTDYCNLRIARVPDGPVLYFRIHAFTLIRHIQRVQRKPIALNTTSMTNYAPIVVTNNFGDHTASSHIKLLRITFQNLFPQVNVSTIQLKDCRRVVLFHLIEQKVESSGTNKDDDADAETSTKEPTTIQMIEMRHYAVKATPLGMNRRVRRILEVAKKSSSNSQQCQLPNLHNVNDIADYITNQSTTNNNNSNTNDDANSNNYMSDSEPEDDVEHQVTLPDTYVGVGNVAKQKSALKLIEIGPRLSLQLLKVEKGLENQKKQNVVVLYNVHVTKTKEEVEQKQVEVRAHEQIREERKRIQEHNVEQKRRLTEERVQQKQQIKMQQQQQQESEDGGDYDDDDDGTNNNDVTDNIDGDNNDDNDNAYKIEGVSSSDDDDDDDDDDNDDNQNDPMDD